MGVTLDRTATHAARGRHADTDEWLHGYIARAVPARPCVWPIDWK